MMFDPFKSQLNLPTIFLEHRNFDGGDFKIVGQNIIRFFFSFYYNGLIVWAFPDNSFEISELPAWRDDHIAQRVF